MCTAITFGQDNRFFGRTLDHTESYGESVIIFPRLAPLRLRHQPPMTQHYAMIGIGCIRDGFPLYYDGVNEKGLAMAGLNFTKSAQYGEPTPGCMTIAQFELLPWLLGQCATVNEAAECLKLTCVTGAAFSPELPPAKLHWMLSDRQKTVVLEIMADGIHWHDNPAGILTNEPPFPVQMARLNDYMGLSTAAPASRFSQALPMEPISRGMGALGLPGDISSQSRFVRAAFWRSHILPGRCIQETVTRFFQLQDTVRVLPGCCQTESGAEEYTLYQSCYANGVCYYSAGSSRQITAVDLHRENLDGSSLVTYTLNNASEIFPQS